MDWEHIIEALKKNRYAVSFFHTKEEAVAYLEGMFEGAVIGFGDSVTMSQMGLNEALSKKNTVIDPKKAVGMENFLRTAKESLTTEYYFTSVNGMTEDGILINLDGTGNRVAGSLFGHKKVFFIVGRNKIAPDLEQAVWRVRNIAAPKNAHRKKMQTPCAVLGDKCYDCDSPDRICNGLLIQMKKMRHIEEEIILIDEDLGY